MGIGNMTRRLGMNQGRTRRTAKQEAEALEQKALENDLGSLPKTALDEALDESERKHFPPEEGGPENGWLPAEGPPRKRTRRSNEVTVVDVKKCVEDLVSEFADIEFRLKELNERKGELKEDAIRLAAEHGLDDLVGGMGKVQVIKAKAPVTLDKKRVQALLTEEQWKACHKIGKVPAPSVKFVPPKGAK